MQDLEKRVEAILIGRESLFTLLGKLSADIPTDKLKEATKTFNHVNKLIKELIEREEKLVEALKFYADSSIYDDADPYNGEPSSAVADNGVIAKEILKELGVSDDK